MRLSTNFFRSAALFSLLIALSGKSVSAEAIRFSTDPSVWKQLRPTVTMMRDSSAKEKIKDGLRFRGTLSGGDASAVSGEQPMSGYQKYRFTASVCVDTYESSTPHPFSNIPLPFLKCEFLTDEPGGVLGSSVCVNTAWKWGERHDIAIEFRAPYGTTKCRVAIVDDYDRWRLTVNRRDIDYTVDFTVADITIEPIEQFDIDTLYPARRFDFDSMKGGHPRLYLTDSGFAELKKKILTTHAALYEKVKTQADDLLKAGPPAWKSNDTGDYDEQWWMANNGPSMITLALIYRLTGEKAYLDGARNWALTTCAYPGWGVGWADGIDCMTGHNLYGLAVVYDWLFHDLDSSALNTIRGTILTRGGHHFEKAATGTIVPSYDDFKMRPWPEWEEVWLQNHLWVNATGLLAAGLALYDEQPETRHWVVFAQSRFEKTMEYLGPDGASHEGINYWSYGIEHLLKSMYLMRGSLGEDLFHAVPGSDEPQPWFANTARYRQYMAIPRSAWKKQFLTVNYGDSHPRDATGPDHILRALAAEYKDPYAQGYARTLDESGLLIVPNRWLNLVWYDPSVPEKSSDDLPTLAHFEDQGIVSARSDWSGNESFLLFKCGPYIGQYALDRMNYCASSAHHTHPDQNEFMLFVGGDWLFRDDGNFGKYTGQHNTLIIDGGEQLGGGDSIFDGIRLHALKRAPKILAAESSTAFDHIAGDAAEAYPPETGLKRFIRHLLYFKKENVLIVCDDIELDTARDLELRFHPGAQEAKRTGDVLTTENGGVTMRFEPLTMDGAALSSEKHPLIDRSYNTTDMLAFRLMKHGDRWRNVTAISWADRDREPAVVTLGGKGQVCVINVGNNRIALNWETGSVSPVR